MGNTVNVSTPDNKVVVDGQSSEQFDSVEEFTEQAYFDGSKIDGFSQVLSNPRGKAAFIKFLNTENGTENFKFFEEMDRLNTLEKKQLGEETETLVGNFKMPVDINGKSTETNEESVDSFSNLAKRTVNENISDTFLESLYVSSNETMVIMSLNVFPNFIGSTAYKEWRIEEAKLVEEAAKLKNNNIETLEKKQPSNKVHPLSASEINSLSHAIVDEKHGSFAARAAEFINPTACDRLFATGSWLGTLISAAEGLPICVTLADASEDNPGFPLLYVNKVFESTTGYTRETIRGTNCKFLQKSSSESESISTISSALANQQPLKVAITNYRKDGTPFKNLLTMKPIFDLDGTYCYVIGVQFDISSPGSNAKVMKLVDSLISLLPNIIPFGGRI